MIDDVAIEETVVRRWIVSQIGARQHYSVPIGFDRLGLLHSFYTDIWCGLFRGMIGRMGAMGKHLLGRFNAELSNRKVYSYTVSNIRRMVLGRSPRQVADRYDGYVTKGTAYAKAVGRGIRGRVSPSDCVGLFAFDTGALETIEVMREIGAPSVVDQIDPARVEEQIVLDECERWRGWQVHEGRIPKSYFERLDREWELADVVYVNSKWCCDALVAQGVAREKIAIAPIAFEGPATDRRVSSETNEGRPLRVLWLGQVNLRKGIQYLMEAAQSLKRESVEFRIAGPVSISESAVESASANMKFEGRVAREEAGDFYRWADVFVLPTLSDGFAITQLEAMSHGLPVIATPNCGDVVTDGEDGFIVPIRDSEKLAEAILCLENDRARLKYMSERAVDKSTKFGIEEVGRQRLEAISKVLERISIGTGFAGTNVAAGPDMTAGRLG